VTVARASRPCPVIPKPRHGRDARATAIHVSDRKPFLLRIDPDLHKAVQRWADDDLRSLNGQIEFLLRKALIDSGRLKVKGDGPAPRAGGRGRKEGS